MKQFCRKNNKGFTLIEVIITIVMAGILAVMMFTYSNTSYTKSSSLLNRSRDTFRLQKVMENIFTDYNLNYKTNLAGIKTKISDPASQQEPPAGYGAYTLVNNDFIKFVGNAEAPIDTGDPQNILKVSIKNDAGETLTILLTLIVTQ